VKPIRGSLLAHSPHQQAEGHVSWDGMNVVCQISRSPSKALKRDGLYAQVDLGLFSRMTLSQRVLEGWHKRVDHLDKVGAGTDQVSACPPNCMDV